MFPSEFLGWLFWVVVVVVSFVVGFRIGGRGLFGIFPDHGNSLLKAKDQKAWFCIVQAFEQIGIAPKSRVITGGIARAFFSARMCVDAPFDSAPNNIKLEGIGGGPVKTVKNPAESAIAFAGFLSDVEYPSVCIHNPDNELPKGSLSVVTSDAFPGGMVVFRKNALKMGGQPTAWNLEDVEYLLKSDVWG